MLSIAEMVKGHVAYEVHLRTKHERSKTSQSVQGNIVVHMHNGSRPDG